MSTTINYYNLMNSHWEPLMDPWEFALTVSRTKASIRECDCVLRTPSAGRQDYWYRHQRNHGGQVHLETATRNEHDGRLYRTCYHERDGVVTTTRASSARGERGGCAFRRSKPDRLHSPGLGRFGQVAEQLWSEQVCSSPQISR
jgi:hypothetical protein